MCVPVVLVQYPYENGAAWLQYHSSSQGQMGCERKQFSRTTSSNIQPPTGDQRETNTFQLERNKQAWGMLEWMLYDENDDEDVFECERMAAACAPVAMARAGWVDCCLYALLLIYSPSSTLHHALNQSGAGLECGSTSNHNHPFSNPTTISTHGYMAQTSESHSQTSGTHSQTISRCWDTWLKHQKALLDTSNSWVW